MTLLKCGTYSRQAAVCHSFCLGVDLVRVGHSPHLFTGAEATAIRDSAAQEQLHGLREYVQQGYDWELARLNKTQPKGPYDE